jgi:hypothetical protein
VTFRRTAKVLLAGWLALIAIRHLLDCRHAREAARPPAAASAFGSRGSSTIGLVPVVVSIAMMWRFGGLQIAFITGWLALMAARNL